MEGLALVAEWNEPFSLKGEELLYIIIITNTANGIEDEAIVNSTRYALSVDVPSRELERGCAVYLFTVFSKNSYNKSSTGVSEYKHIPTGTYYTITQHTVYNFVSYCIQYRLFCIHRLL